MSKVLVDRELLDSAATWLEVHAPGGGCVEGSVAEDLRAILEQPAEAEGVVEMGSDAWMALHLLDRLDVSADDEPRVQQVEEIVRRMGAALSAVTAELDRLLDDAERLEFIEKHWFYEEESGRWAFMYGEDWNKQGLTFRDAIDAARAAMAAKEEHNVE